MVCLFIIISMLNLDVFFFQCCSFVLLLLVFISYSSYSMTIFILEFNTMGRKRSTLSVENRHSQTPSPKHNPIRNNGSTSNLNNLIQSQVQNFHHKRAQSVNSHEMQINFSPCVNDLLDDLAYVNKLTEVKTEIGMARAFVRLSLEKKLLADHLRQLLGEAELLRALYKKHAFLRQEDEREQFIYHLQSLNVVDHFCFTNHFKSIPTDYSVILMPCKRLNSSTTSANPYIKLFGTLGESEIFSIPRNNFQFIISVRITLSFFFKVIFKRYVF